MGVELVSVESSVPGSNTLWKVLGYSFFLHSIDGRAEMMEYAVPSAVTGRVEKEMKRNRITSKLLHTLDNANETKRSAFTELLARPEL